MDSFIMVLAILKFTRRCHLNASPSNSHCFFQEIAARSSREPLSLNKMTPRRSDPQCSIVSLSPCVGSCVRLFALWDASTVGSCGRMSTFRLYAEKKKNASVRLITQMRQFMSKSCQSVTTQHANIVQDRARIMPPLRRCSLM